MIENRCRGTRNRYRPQTVSQPHDGLPGDAGRRIKLDLSLDGCEIREPAAAQGTDGPLAQAQETALQAVRARLDRDDLIVKSYAQLSSKDKKKLRQLYYHNIYPLLTPRSVGPAHPFPSLPSLSSNVLATLRDPATGELSLGYLTVPVCEGVPRFLRVGEADCLVPLEAVVMANLDLLFPGMEVVECQILRATCRPANRPAGDAPVQ